MGSIFISYSHKQSDIVNSFADKLLDARYLFWLDKKDIKTGDFWDLHIKTAIASCSVFLMFLSRDYLNSDYCNDEFEHAKLNKHAKIYIYDLDNSINDLSLKNDYSSVQMFNNGDLLSQIEKNDDFNNCKKANINFKYDEDLAKPLISFLGQLKIVSYHICSEILLKLVSLLLEKEKEGKYLASEADFSSLMVQKVNSELFVNLIGDTDFKNILNVDVRSNYLKNVINEIFAYRSDPFDKNIDLKYLKINQSFVDEIKKEYGEIDDALKGFLKNVSLIFEEMINDILETIDNLNLTFEKALDLSNASKYYHNLLERYYNHSKYIDHDISPLTLKVNHVYFLSLYHQYEIDNASLPDLIDDQKMVYFANQENPLLTISKKNHSSLQLFGRYGCGGSSLLIDFYLKKNNCLYIDLTKIVNYKFVKDKYIEHSLSLNFPNSIGLEFLSLANYSAYNQKIYLLLDNYDYLSESDKQLINREVGELKNIFFVIFYSRKRNISQNIDLSDKENKDPILEILPLNKEKILSYLHFRNVDDNYLNAIKFFDDEFFEFFNSFSKLNLLSSLLNDKNYDLDSLKENLKDKFYQDFYLGDEDFSLAKLLCSYFHNDEVDISSLIKDEWKKEYTLLKKIAYEKDFKSLKDLMLINLLVKYDVAYKLNDQYFLHYDALNYFKSQYLKDLIINLINLEDYRELDFLVSHYLEDYSLLHLLAKYSLFSKQFIKSVDNKLYPSLELFIYKLSLYDVNDVKEIMECLSMEEIPELCLANCENIKVIYLPHLTKKIGHAAFANMARLEKADLSSKNSELEISAFIFINCPNLNVIYLGENYHNYHHPLLRKCQNLQKIFVSKKNQYFSTILDNQILTDKNQETIYLGINSLNGDVVLPRSVKYITEHALAYLDNITSLNISSSRTISTDFTDFCPKLERYYADENSKYYVDKEGILYLKENQKISLFRVPPGRKENIYINDNIDEIGGDSLSTCGEIQKVYVGGKVKTISSYAFADMVSLAEIHLENIDIETVELKKYLFLSSNENVKIFVKNEFDEIKELTLKEFNLEYNQENVKQVKSDLPSRQVNLNLLKNDFEIINQCEDNEKRDSIIMLRNNKEFEDAIKLNEKSYNICLIGLDEFNKLNQMGNDDLRKYFEDLINKKNIKMFAILRDLPLIKELLFFKDRVSIIRSKDGFIKGSMKLINLLKEGV